MKKILVAIDGSANSFKALDFASDLAQKYGAELLLLHVAPSAELPESVRRFAEVEHIEGPPEWVYGQVIAQNILSNAQERARAKGATKIAARVREGDPAKVIVETARNEHADAIAMGTRGLSDLRGLLMGSVAHKVSHLAECTVITVK
jgi:nucleotide-binding universal stress UspA family protein